MVDLVEDDERPAREMVGEAVRRRGDLLVGDNHGVRVAGYMVLVPTTPTITSVA